MRTTRARSLSFWIAAAILLALGMAPLASSAAAPVEKGEMQLAQAAPMDPVRSDVERAASRGGSLLVGIATLLVAGLVIGVIAKLLMPGPDGGGIVMTSLLGIAGAFVGGLIASVLGVGSFQGFSLGALVIAVLGAMLLLLLQRRLRRA